jgi:hypothetical protein
MFTRVSGYRACVRFKGLVNIEQKRPTFSPTVTYLYTELLLLLVCGSLIPIIGSCEKGAIMVWGPPALSPIVRSIPVGKPPISPLTITLSLAEI